MTRTVGAVGPTTATIAIVGQAPAAEEMRLGVPFIGRSGHQLNQCLLYARLRREELYITNVFHRQLAEGEGIFTVSDQEREACLARLTAELQAMPNLRVVIPLGEDAMWAVTGLRGVTKWRGSIVDSTLVSGVKAVPSVHPAWIIRGQWVYRSILIVDLQKALEVSNIIDFAKPSFDYVIGPSFEQACDTMLSFPNDRLLSVDIELHRRQFIACVGCANGLQPAICIPICYGDGMPVWTPQEERQLWQIIAITMRSRIPKVGQNVPFDIVHLLRAGIITRNVVMDTITMHHCERVEMPHTLAFMVSVYTPEQFYKDEGRYWHPSMGHEQFWLYNVKDAYWTLQIALKLRERLQAQGLWEFYQQTYIRELPLRVRMEWEGVKIDIDRRRQADIEITERVDQLQADVNKQVGREINVRSNKQLQQYLYQERRFKTKYARGTGKPTTNKTALAALAKDPTVANIVELRKLLDLRSDVIRQPLDSANRIHCHYSYAETLRWTSSESVLGTGTNLQNIPREGVARKLFVPDVPGQVFLCPDLVQAEAMIVAWDGPVPGLKALFESGGDVHLEVARLVNRLVRSIGINVPMRLFMSDPAELTKKSPERQIMKHAVHGSNYEMGRSLFAQTAASKGGQQISDAAFLDAAMKAQDLYHQLFPEVRSNYHRRIQDELRASHTLWTPKPFRWRRHFHGPISDELFREGYAFRPQFLVAMVMNEILRRIDRQLWPLDACIRMQIHDEGVIQLWPETVREVVQLVLDAHDIDLELTAGKLRIPLAFKVGPSLGELEDYKP